MIKFDTLDEATEYIINHMRDSEKDMIKNADPASIHMALARWANTQYISNDNYNFKELVLNQLREDDPSLQENGDDLLYIHNDNIVGIIIDKIIEKIQA